MNKRTIIFGIIITGILILMILTGAIFLGLVEIITLFNIYPLALTLIIVGSFLLFIFSIGYWIMNL